MLGVDKVDDLLLVDLVGDLEGITDFLDEAEEVIGVDVSLKHELVVVFPNILKY